MIEWLMNLFNFWQENYKLKYDGVVEELEKVISNTSIKVRAERANFLDNMHIYFIKNKINILE